eukprot:680446-Alexandrium_andersonii.AAC.1
MCIRDSHTTANTPTRTHQHQRQQHQHTNTNANSINTTNNTNNAVKNINAPTPLTPALTTPTHQHH